MFTTPIISLGGSLSPDSKYLINVTSSIEKEVVVVAVTQQIKLVSPNLDNYPKQVVNIVESLRKYLD